MFEKSKVIVCELFLKISLKRRGLAPEENGKRKVSGYGVSELTSFFSTIGRFSIEIKNSGNHFCRIFNGKTPKMNPKR